MKVDFLYYIIYRKTSVNMSILTIQDTLGSVLIAGNLALKPFLTLPILLHSFQEKFYQEISLRR